jgi:hypothetical protein
MEVREQFADAVREALAGLTPNQASYKTGVSHEQIRKMRHGVVASDPTLRRFAEGLGADLHKLRVAAGYEEEPPSGVVEALGYGLRGAEDISEEGKKQIIEFAKKIREEYPAKKEANEDA